MVTLSFHYGNVANQDIILDIYNLCLRAKDIIMKIRNALTVIVLSLSIGTMVAHGLISTLDHGMSVVPVTVTAVDSSRITYSTKYGKVGTVECRTGSNAIMGDVVAHARVWANDGYRVIGTYQTELDDPITNISDRICL